MPGGSSQVLAVHPGPILLLLNRRQHRKVSGEEVGSFLLLLRDEVGRFLKGAVELVLRKLLLACKTPLTAHDLLHFSLRCVNL